MTEKPVEAGNYKGWLWKWTNYIKGYQRRWFVLSDGLLSYYRSQAEMAHTCRGTINLAGAFIVTEESCNFTVSNGGTQTFHLKANHEVERQRWITALELAKAKLVSWCNEGSSDDEGSMDEHDKNDRGSIGVQENDIITSLKALSTKLDDLQTYNDLITKQGNALQKAVTELEITGTNESGDDSASLLSKQVTERAALFRITSTAMISNSSEFLQLARDQSTRWRKAIMHERCQRLRLEETVETLAKQHNSLEKAIRSENSIYDGHSSGESDTEEWADASEGYYEALKQLTVTNITPSGSIQEEASTSKALTSKPKVYRKSIPFKPDYSLNLWSIMKNCIGRDLSKIPMPVNFSEPLSMLQRLGEDLEYCHLLHQASKLTNAHEQMAYVVAYSVSGYASTISRIGKPFNPLLGETFEIDRLDDMGFRLICEQVGHHPPCAAFHADSHDCTETTGWSYWTDITVSSKFRGKYLSVTPEGTMHVKFHATGNHYTWKKVTTTVHNIIVGKLWVDQSGDCEVINHTTGDKCKHKYHQYSYFSRDVARKVDGTINDKFGKSHLTISGTWDKSLDFAKFVPGKSAKNPPPSKQIWKINAPPPNSDKMYHFSSLAMTLNQPDEDVAPTDSRNRPDQRQMEKGAWDDANATKLQLEQAQRNRRAARKGQTAGKSVPNVPRNSSDISLNTDDTWEPLWFKAGKCRVTGENSFKFTNKYWKNKMEKDWSASPKIYELEQKASKNRASDNKQKS